MKTRIVTALVLIPLLVLVLISPAPVVTAAVMAVCVIGLYEFFKAVGISKKRCLCALGYAAAVVIPLGAYAGGIWDISRLYMPLAYLFMLLVFLVMLTQHKTVSFSDAAALIFAVIYIPYFLTHIIYVREALNGKILIWLVFIGAFLTDSGAYFAGVFFGRHKLCPEISPKKTVEGAVGGIVCCIAFCVIYALIINTVFGLQINIAKMAAFGAVISVISQIGDLSASIIKRRFGIKDYGNIFPGHGGILDRCDSVILVAPAVYLFITYIGL